MIAYNIPVWIDFELITQNKLFCLTSQTEPHQDNSRLFELNLMQK